MIRNFLRTVAERVGILEPTRAVTFHAALACARCGTIMAWLVKPGRLPKSMATQYIDFPDIDKEDRLSNAQGVGINVVYQVNSAVYNYTTGEFALSFAPFMLHPSLSTETIALFLSLLKAAGWRYKDAEEDAKWDDKWTAHQAEKPKHEQHACHAHSQIFGPFPVDVEQLFGGGDDDEDEDDEEEEAPKKRRKTRKRGPDEEEGETNPTGP